MSSLFQSRYNIKMKQIDNHILEQQEKSKRDVEVSLSRIQKASEQQRYWVEQQIRAESIRVHSIADQIKTKRMQIQNNLKSPIKAQINNFSPQSSRVKSPTRKSTGKLSCDIDTELPSRSDLINQLEYERAKHQEYYRQMLKKQRLQNQISEIISRY